MGFELLTIRKAWVPAPWAGRESRDVFYVGVDEQGRCVASRNTKRVYEGAVEAYMSGWTEASVPDEDVNFPAS